MITANQFHSAGCVVRQSDLLTVLPRSFVPAAGFAWELACRTLPFEMQGIDVALLWHRQHEHDAAQRWLRDLVRSTAVAMAQHMEPADRERPGTQRSLGRRAAPTRPGPISAASLK